MNRDTRRTWLVVTLGFVLIIFALALSFFSSKTIPPNPTSSPSFSSGPSSAPLPAAQSKPWIGQRFEVRATPENEQIAIMERALNWIMQYTRPAPYAKVPLSDPEVLRQVEEAKRRIHERAPEGAWEWERVFRAAQTIGGDIPLITAPPEFRGSDVTMIQYDPTTKVMALWPKRLRDLPPEFITSVFVHETTHHVVLEELESRSRYTSEELIAFSARCIDHSLIFNFISETLAFWNQGVWLRREGSPEAIAFTNKNSSPLLLALATATDGVGSQAYLDFGQAVLEYATRLTRDMFDRLPKDSYQKTCLPAVILRGPDRGRRFFPSDLAPELLEQPLLRMRLE